MRKNMARPVKKGLDYFPLDVNIFDDDKLFDVQNEFGPLGEVIYLRILCLIYKNGYYYKFESLDKLAAMLIKSIGNKWARDKQTVVQVIPFLAECNLLSSELMQKNVLTSASIQRRYLKATERRQSMNNMEYMLIDESGNDLLNAHNNLINVYMNEDNVYRNAENVDRNAPKERKVKESKGKNKESIGRTPAFSKPTLEEIRAYCIERNNSIDPERFYDYYESNGWMVGRGKMKDWRATVRNWERREKGSGNGRKKPEKKNPYLEMLRKEQMKNDQRGNNENDSNALIGISEPQ